VKTAQISPVRSTSTFHAPDDHGQQWANPEMQAVLDQLAALGGKPLEQLTPQEARRQPFPADAVTALLKKRGQSTTPERVADVEDKSINGPGGEIAIRIYTPEGQGPFPVIVYIHGGGWVIADLDVYDSSPRALANAAQAIVVSTHYRLAPEHPFPASHEDVFTAYQWVRENAGSHQGDSNRIAVAGESAGGNMAAAISLMAREQNVPLPLHQVLIYPVAGTDMSTPSFREHSNAKPLNKAMMEWFAKHELKNPQDKLDPRIDLLNADLQGLPSTTIITAEIDPLRSAGRMLADKLEAAGVQVDFKNYEGVTHEFFGMGAVLEQSREATKFAARNLVKAFHLVSGRPPMRAEDARRIRM
jgi:acetyl esterase